MKDAGPTVDAMDPDAPWLSVYGDLPRTIVPEHSTALAMTSAAFIRAGADPLVWYFDRGISGQELRQDSDALACALAADGVAAGDRVALMLQNCPQMLVALRAAWSLGAVAVPINPMFRERELAKVLADCGAEVMFTLDELYEDVVAPAVAASAVRTVITTSASDYRSEGLAPAPARAFRGEGPLPTSLRALLDDHAGQAPGGAGPGCGPDDVALLVYTSGTTGPAKGAMVLHRNFVYSSEVFRSWARLGAGDVNLVLAPVFHVTGLVAGLGASLAAGMPMLLSFRFDVEAVLEQCARHRPTFTVAAITAYGALMAHPDFPSADLSCLRAAYSGGAPVPPALVARWEEATGRYIHNAYGLTETTSPTHLTPLGTRAPVDPVTGVLSVGVPVSGTSVEVVDDEGKPLPPGEIGQFATAGPQVVPGYWQQPAETRLAFRDGRLRTGDVGFRDAEGWFYLVDRSKDMIVAAGYKVWPREVEDVLYEHASIREAAVVGVPDAYRGETVKAYVSLRPGSTATPSELMAFCKSRMAAYKYPRQLEILPELPKTVTGKILRRELRDRDGQV